MNRIARKYEEAVDGAQQKLERHPPQTRRLVVGVAAGLCFCWPLWRFPYGGPFSVLLSFVGLTVLSWEFQFARTLRSEAKTRVDQARSNLSKRGK